MLRRCMQEGGKPMETRIVHYQSTEQMEGGVAKLEAEGWVLQALTSIPDATPGGETVRAEFARSDDTTQHTTVGKQAVGEGADDVSRQGA